MRSTLSRLVLAAGVLALPSPTLVAQEAPAPNSVREAYTKHEFKIRMRDGVSLFTAVYTPKDSSRTYPILMQRTPYSVEPYGIDNCRGRLGHRIHRGSSVTLNVVP